MSMNMFVEEVSFNEEEFLRIYREEMALIRKEKPDFACFGFMSENSAISSKNFVEDIKRVINFIYQTAFQAINPRYVAVRSSRNPILMIPESIGGHTMIMVPIYLGFKDMLRNHHFNTPEEVFLEAIRIHDIPENKFSDIPDNGCAEHDRENKDELEREQMMKYRKYIPKSRLDIFDRAVRLLDDKEKLSTVDSRIFYLDDKIAAIFLPLTGFHAYITAVDNSEILEPKLVSDDYMPRISFEYTGNEKLASREREELKIIRGTRKPSLPVPAFELWTADFLAVRKMTLYDHYGYFTAILVAYTLAMRGEWYSWREAMYDSNHNHKE